MRGDRVDLVEEEEVESLKKHIVVVNGELQVGSD
jgi:hypothetical protein